MESKSEEEREADLEIEGYSAMTLFSFFLKQLDCSLAFF